MRVGCVMLRPRESGRSDVVRSVVNDIVRGGPVADVVW